MAGNREIDKEEALKICQEFLSGPWLDISVGEFGFSVVRGGLMNSMYRCSLPENSAVKRAPSDVLLRIYGSLQDETNIIVTEATTFMLLAERKLGPKLYGVFPDGRLEEFIPSRSLKTEDYRALHKVIAREMAKVHAMDVPVRKVPDFWPVYATKWLNQLEEENFQRQLSFEQLEMYKEEIEWLGKDIKKSKSPIVYCHNDLQGGNILLRQDSSVEENPRIMLIDFEFGAYNYRTFDIANQFCEWCFDYNTEEYPYYTFDFQKFPTKDEQTSFVQAYLDQLVKEGCLEPSNVQEELMSILREVPLFGMAANILWSLWSIIMSFPLPTNRFSHWEHGKTRRRVFFIFKEQYLKAQMQNGNSDIKSTEQ